MTLSFNAHRDGLDSLSTKALFEHMVNTLTFTPTTSAVLIGLHGNGHLGTTIRCDLDTAIEAPRDIGNHLGSLLSLEHDGCFILALTDTEPGQDTVTRQAQAAVTVMADQLQKDGITVHDAQQIGGGYEHSLFDILASYPGAPAPYAIPDATELTPQRLVARYTHGVAAALVAREIDQTPSSDSAGLQVWDNLMSAKTTTDTLTVAQLADVVATMQPHAISAVLAVATTDLATGLQELAANHSCLDSDFITTAGPTPDWQRFDRLADAMADIAPYVKDANAANVHAVMSWVQFAKGQSSAAVLFAEHALRLDPGHALAGHILTGIKRGAIALWATHSSTCYQSSR